MQCREIRSPLFLPAERDALQCASTKDPEGLGASDPKPS